MVNYLGKPVKSLQNARESAVKAAKIDRPVRLYDLRHLHITHALAAGAPILELAERVGHANTSMIVNVYAHLVDDIRTKEPHHLPPVGKAL